MANRQRDELGFLKRILGGKILGQRALGERARVHPAMISHLRTGRTQSPRYGTVLRLVTAARDMIRERVFEGDRRTIEFFAGQMSNGRFLAAAALCARLRSEWADADAVIDALMQFREADTGIPIIPGSENRTEDENRTENENGTIADVSRSR